MNIVIFLTCISRRDACGDPHAALFPRRGEGGEHVPRRRAAACDAAHALEGFEGAGGRVGKEALYEAQLFHLAYPGGRFAPQPGGGSGFHGRQDRKGVPVPGRAHRGRHLFRSGGVVSDPLSCAGDPKLQGRVSRAPLSHHQRRHGAGDGEAGQGAAGLRGDLRDAGREKIPFAPVSRVGPFRGGDAGGFGACRQGRRHRGRSCGPAAFLLRAELGKGHPALGEGAVPPAPSGRLLPPVL